MADTKWLDPNNWTLADWEDDTRRPLFGFLWDTLRGASRERLAFIEQTHESGFPAAYEFPDYVTDKSIPLSADSNKIKNGVFPLGINDVTLIDNDDMVDGGTVTSNADVPEALGLTEILDATGYGPDTKMLHSQDLSDGTRAALARMAWIVQWYKIMDYMTWFNTLIVKNGIGGNDADWISDIETQYYSIQVFYSYTPPSTFNSAKCEEIYPTSGSTPTDIYTSGDLNETAPFSSIQDVRTYAISKYNPNAATWVSVSNGQSLLVLALQAETVFNLVASDVAIDCDLTQRRLRFKINDAYRATSPNRYTPDVYWFLYYTTTTGTFSDFGEGFSNTNNSLVTLTADGSGWYYLENSPDFDTEPVLSMPSSGNSDAQEFSCRKRSLTPDIAYDANVNSIYLKPNKTDGTQFEWYTPAP